MSERLTPERQFIIQFTIDAPTDTAALILARNMLRNCPNLDARLEGVYERSDLT